MDELAELSLWMGQLDRVRKINKLQHYNPYPYQLEFHNKPGKNSPHPAAQRLLMAANKVGKTT